MKESGLMKGLPMGRTVGQVRMDVGKIRARHEMNVMAVMDDYVERVNADPVHNSSVFILLVESHVLFNRFLDCASEGGDDEDLCKIAKHLTNCAKELMRAQATGVADSTRNADTVIAVVPETVERGGKSLEDRIRESMNLEDPDAC